MLDIDEKKVYTEKKTETLSIALKSIYSRLKSMYFTPFITDANIKMGICTSILEKSEIWFVCVYILSPILFASQRINRQQICNNISSNKTTIKNGIEMRRVCVCAKNEVHVYRVVNRDSSSLFHWMSIKKYLRSIEKNLLARRMYGIKIVVEMNNKWNHILNAWTAIKPICSEE